MANRKARERWAKAALTMFAAALVAFDTLTVPYWVCAWQWRRIREEVASEVVVAQRDSGFDLAKAKGETYWIPAANRGSLVVMLTELRANVYRIDTCDVLAGDVVLDCGANVGVFTRYALRRGARKVLAIEPAPDNLECLRRNFDREIRAGVVVVCDKGVWDRDAELLLNVVDGDTGRDSVALKPTGARQGPRVALTTIDKLVRETGLDRVDFVKMDIEGAECRALRGAGATIARWHPRMAISGEHFTGQPEQVIELLRATWPGVRISRFPSVPVRLVFSLKRQMDDQTVFAW